MVRTGCRMSTHMYTAVFTRSPTTSNANDPFAAQSRTTPLDSFTLRSLTFDPAAAAAAAAAGTAAAWEAAGAVSRQWRPSASAWSRRWWQQRCQQAAAKRSGSGNGGGGQHRRRQRAAGGGLNVTHWPARVQCRAVRFARPSGPVLCGSGDAPGNRLVDVAVPPATCVSDFTTMTR